MSQINALVDLLANDPEIIALLDGFPSNGVPPIPAGGVFSSQIDPTLFASQPGTFGGPTESTIAEKIDLISRGIGTDRFGLEFAAGLGENPAGPPRLTDAFGGVGGPQRPAGDLPSPIDPTFTVAGRQQFLGGQREQVLGEQQATQQRIEQNQVQVQLNAEAAAQQNPVNQLIQQLANAFGGVHRIPPISSSFIGTEPLEGAIPGSQPSFGVNAGRFLVGRFGSQEEADQARDTLRSALQQGPAPPPTLGLFGGVLSPFGRTGAQQFDDARAFSQEQRLAFKALEEAGVPVGRAFAAFGGGRMDRGRGGGGAIGGGRPFTTTKRAVPLGGDLGFTFLDKIDELRPLGLPAGLGVSSREQELLDILNGELRGRSAGEINRIIKRTGETIGRLFDEDALTGDEALLAEIMRDRLAGVARTPGQKPAQFEAGLRRLLRQSPTQNETRDAADRLVVNPDDLNSELLRQITNERDALVQARMEAERRAQTETRTEAAAERAARGGELREIAFTERVPARERFRVQQTAQKIANETRQIVREAQRQEDIARARGANAEELNGLRRRRIGEEINQINDELKAELSRLPGRQDPGFDLNAEFLLRELANERIEAKRFELNEGQPDDTLLRFFETGQLPFSGAGPFR